MKEIGSEFSLCEDQNYYFRKLIKIGKKVQFLRCGRDAIGYLADFLPKKTEIVLMPSYCCDSMVDPFIFRGWKVIYYPINSDFSIDVNYLQSLIKKMKPDVILIMNFFGISNTINVVNIIKQDNPELQIIEDITHILFDLDKLCSQQVNYYVGSIRKWIGIPDGAIVISNNNKIPVINYVENNFVNLRRTGLNLKEDYLHTNSQTIKILFRKILLEAENSLEKGKIPYCISPESQSILQNLNTASLKKARKWNAITLLQKLKTIPQISFPINIDRIYENTPFSIPIFISNRDEIQKEMAENGIYVAVLWPLSDEARKISPISVEIENTILSIPIDQRYDFADMDNIFNVIKKIVSN